MLAINYFYSDAYSETFPDTSFTHTFFGLQITQASVKRAAGRNCTTFGFDQSKIFGADGRGGKQHY